MAKSSRNRTIPFVFMRHTQSGFVWPHHIDSNINWEGVPRNLCDPGRI